MDYEQVKEQALTYLEYRSHSEEELRRKLRRKGADEKDIDSVCDFLKEYKLLDDADYARRVAHDLAKLKKYGSYRVKRELMSRGIDEETASLSAEEYADDELQTLSPLVKKKLGGNFEKKNIDKTIRYFLYRGYSYDDIRSCINDARSGADWDGDDYGL